MLRKIIALFLVAGSAMAVSTSNYAIVTYDGIALKTNGVSIEEAIEIVKPAYFCVSEEANPQVLAASVEVLNGTIESGTVTNTWETDQSYLIVGESGQFDVRFTHTNITSEIIEVLFTGYYDGNPAHEIDLYLWDFTAGAWDLILDDALPTDGADTTLTVPIPEPQTNYVSGGVATSRWFHSASTSPSHDFGIDYTAILQAQVTMPTANVFVALGGYADCVTEKGFTGDLEDGTFTNTTAGVYSFTLGGSGTGSTNTIFRGAVFTNDVITPIQFYRKINAGGDVGNAWGHGLLNLPAGTKIDARIAGDTDNSHAAFFDFKFKCNKIDN